MLKYIEEVKKEFNHPIRINFFATVSISFLLLSVALHAVSIEAAYYTFVLGMILQTYFTLRTISFWINKNLELHHSNPAWFIPIVGNVLVPVAGVGFVSNHLLMYYFSIGMFFWIILTAILINRIIFHHQLIAFFFMFLASLIVFLVALKTIQNMFKGEICIEE